MKWTWGKSLFSHAISKSPTLHPLDLANFFCDCNWGVFEFEHLLISRVFYSKIAKRFADSTIWSTFNRYLRNLGLNPCYPPRGIGTYIIIISTTRRTIQTKSLPTTEHIELPTDNNLDITKLVVNCIIWGFGRSTRTTFQLNQLNVEQVHAPGDVSIKRIARANTF